MGKNNQSENPYAPPKSIKPFSADGLTEPAYSDGVDLIFRSDFVSPRVCLITGRNVAEQVPPIKLAIFRFSIKNYPWIKNMYLVIVASFVLTRFFLDGYGLLPNIPLYLLLAVHLIPAFSKKKSHVNFYYVEYLRVKETKKAWKYMLIFIPSLGFLIYGLSVKSYLFTVVGMALILNFIIIVQSGSVMRYKRGDKQYYRLGDIHPRFLGFYPKLD